MRIEKFVFGPVGTNCYIVINGMDFGMFCRRYGGSSSGIRKAYKRCRTLRKSAAFDAWSL